MESNIFDESIGMTDFDYATLNASSLDIANTFARDTIDAGLLPTYCRRMATKDVITNKLREAFSPESLEVSDESHLHEGHAGHRPGGETHYRVYIVSPAFKGKSRLERHRMVNAVLAAELQGGVHALAIHAKAPGED